MCYQQSHAAVNSDNRTSEQQRRLSIRHEASTLSWPDSPSLPDSADPMTREPVLTALLQSTHQQEVTLTQWLLATQHFTSQYHISIGDLLSTAMTQLLNGLPEEN